MSDLNKKTIQKALARLRNRRKGAGAGALADADIARVLNVHPTTLHRWLRGESTPQDAQTIQRLIILSQQAYLWYRRVCPFILAVWSSSDSQQDDGDPYLHSSVFDQVIFEPVQEAEILRVKIRCTIDFDSLYFFVIGIDRGNVGLGYTPRGPFASNIRLPEKSRNIPEFKKGELIEMYMKYEV